MPQRPGWAIMDAGAIPSCVSRGRSALLSQGSPAENAPKKRTEFLSAQPELVEWLHSKAQAARWGVGSTKPMFQFYVFAEPAPAAVKTA